MEATHGDLKQYFPDGLPKFPSKHLLRNPTKPENMQKRAAEFLIYFQTLVATPAVVRHPSFHTAYRIPAEWIPSLSSGQVQVPNKQPPARVPPKQAFQPFPRKPQPKKNLFDDDDDDDDDEDALEASTVSVEAPEPVFAQNPANRSNRAVSSASSSSRMSIDRRPSSASMRREDRASSRRSIQMDRQPSRKEVPSVAGLPQRPNLFGGGRGNLLAEIRKGTQLNKVGNDPSTPAPASSPPPPAANNLLAALQQAAPLKKATPPTSQASAAAPPPLVAPSIHDSIAHAMSIRQMHTQYDHDSDDGSDDEWDD
ncbi:hypothetical protein Ae201684P_004018 [Aphanomyces euteiches]|nr:hypothetical protein Ae201684P_004018 [Aphanomyces euteiches]